MISSNGTDGNSSQLTPQNKHDTDKPTSNDQPPPVSPRPHVKSRMVNLVISNAWILR